VYATAETVTKARDNPRWNQALLAISAMLTTPTPGAVASHETAALLHGLDLLNEPQENLVTLTRPPSSYAGRGDGIRFRSAELIPAHVTKAFGVSVTTAARTVMDIARISPFMDGVVVADSALRERKAAKAELNAVLDQCVRWPGVDRARQVAAFSDGRSESVLESCGRVTFERRGLERPELQVEIRTRGGAFRVDYYWRKHQTIAEADGLMKYEDPKRAITQLKRDQLLRETGHDVIHFTWQQLFHEEDRVIAWLTGSFARRPA
jgi:very-short-patch-repair endonuclease